MEVNSFGQTSPTNKSLTTESSANSALASDFDTFLKMLTTQMENQDPLNPIESSDFAVQLATFSGVEQQIRTNDLLAEMVAGSTASGLGQVAAWVGMEAKVSGSARFEGVPITLAPKVDTASDAAFLVVRDTNGQLVSREQLPLNASFVVWAGTSSSGVPLPSGDYSFEIESINGGEVTGVSQVDYYAKITEVRFGTDGIEIALNNGPSVSVDDVQALRSTENI